MSFDEIRLNGLWRLDRFHDLVDPDPEDRHLGVACDTEWCNALHDPKRECGDRQGDYTGLVHVNRQYRALHPEQFCPEGLCDGSGWLTVDPDEHPAGGVNPCPCGRAG